MPIVRKFSLPKNGINWLLEIAFIVYVACWYFDIPVLGINSAANVRATSGSIAIGNNANNNVFTIYNNSPEELARMVRACVSQTQIASAEREQALQKVRNLSAQLNIENDAIISLFRVVGQESVPIDQLQSKLIEIVKQYQSTRRVISQFSFADEGAQQLANSANIALSAGRLIEADEMLRQAALRELGIAHRQSIIPGEQSDSINVQTHVLNAARAGAGRGEISLLQLQYDEAALRFADAAALVPENVELSKPL